MKSLSTPNRFPRTVVALWIAVLGAWFSTPSVAHNLEFTEVLLVLDDRGGFQANMICDLDALALGVSPESDSAELEEILRNLSDEELEDVHRRLVNTFDRRVRVLFDGQRVDLNITFPELRNPLERPLDIPTFFGLTARFEGLVPEGAEVVSFRASRAFPPVTLTVFDQHSRRNIFQLVEQGTESSAFPLVGDPESTMQEDPLEVAGRYLVLGFWHIVPEGLDHILFVLGLFLLSPKPRPLIFQVTAFTLAHAVTLSLATLGIFNLPPSIVEPLIALSIAWVAVENIRTDKLHPSRPAVVFGFGLLHGLGFAGVLGELGLPDGQLVAALLSFNLGIEFGQLAVLGAAFLVIGIFHRKPWYRQRLTIPLSYAIAAVGLYWAVERIFF